MSPPKTIDGYPVVRELGRGDFATVYEVQRDGEPAALKLCHTSTSEARERLRAEAAALKALAHKGIPTFMKAGVEGDRPYVVMSLARGQTLKAGIDARESIGSVFGDIEALRLLRQLLDALAHAHSRDLVHRDVKDANVLATEAGDSLTLIDFGFSKTHGDERTRSDDSFWRAGAARFSPPAKLDNPAKAVASHDVFAAGVVGYRMLTGQFPWNAGASTDYSALRRLMERPARPVADLNSRVRPRASHVIASLLETDDTKRPTSAEALRRVDEALDTLERMSGVLRGTQRIQLPKVIRDALYGDIRITAEEWQVLQTREMQRLRGIKQLGLTNIVYPGAEHTRYSHAIGCVHRVEQILRAIEDNEAVTFDRETRLTARMYALVHDVTHIPFGHTLEDELCFFVRHDNNEPRIHRMLLGPQSHLREAVANSEVGPQVLAHFDPDASVHDRSRIEEIVTGSAGADVLDYVDRDSFHCGLDHRVDSAIFRQLRMHRSNSDHDHRLVSLLYGSEGVRGDRAFAVESLLLERYALYLKVYTHKRKIAASALLGKSLAAALHPPRGGKPELTEQRIEQLNDWTMLDVLRNSKRAAVSGPAGRLSLGALPRPVYRAQLLSKVDRDDGRFPERRQDLENRGLFDPARRQDLEAQMARRLKLAPDDVIVYCPPKPPGLSGLNHWVATTPSEAATPLDAVSGPFFGIRQKHYELWELWVFTTADTADDDSRIAGDARSMFGFENLIAADRREDALF